MRTWQVVLAAAAGGGTFYFTMGGPNLLTPTIGLTVCTLSLIALLGGGRTNKKINS